MVDFYAQVPKDLAQNLRYRVEIRRRAQTDEGFRRALWTACRHDHLYFFNAFCWLYEPRPRVVNGVAMPPVIPFITWEHQDKAIRLIVKDLGWRDIGLEKSRGEGASWIAVLLTLHGWLFKPLTAVGLVSKDQLTVDNPEDPDSLFWKLDWELTKLPRWMVPEFNRNLAQHTLRNVENGSTITGYAATQNVGSGGRKRWFVMDELAKFPRGPDADAMASTQHVTDSRLIISTPFGAEGAYYDVMHEPSSMVKVILDWTQNPFRNRGLYKIKDGLPVAVDPANPLPENYPYTSKNLLSRLRSKGFQVEGRLRSPWYDRECDRPGATPQNIAQELGRDYGGSQYRVFTGPFFEKTDVTVRPPFVRGVFDHHPETLQPLFGATPDGPALLWAALDHFGRPPASSYVLGADVSSGLGGSYTSNSVAIVIDAMSMEQVFEFASNTVPPAEFADYCMALGYWFHTAYLIWEHGGPGSGFSPRVLAKGYPNPYFRKHQWKRIKAKQKDVGWVTTGDTKELMFGEFLRSVASGELKLRSDALARECGQYVRIAGAIEHVATRTTKDESSKGKSHGDRVIAACIALQGVRDRPVKPVTDEDLTDFEHCDPPPNTAAARLAEYARAHRAPDDVWDGRTNWDFVLAG